MLCENIKAIRKSKGLSQEELAIKLNVVRQTISKWEQGLSVPDADMLISLSEAFETPVSTLLGEPVTAAKADDLKAVSEKLEIINLQLAQGKELRRKTARCLLIGLCTAIVIISAVFIYCGSPYLGWNYHDPETAVVGVAFHAFEWLFVRFAPRSNPWDFPDTEEGIERACFGVQFSSRNSSLRGGRHCFHAWTTWAAVFRGENSCPRLLLTGGNMTGCEGAEIQA